MTRTGRAGHLPGWRRRWSGRGDEAGRQLAACHLLSWLDGIPLETLKGPAWGLSVVSRDLLSHQHETD
ncbi:hypothetical protein E2C01_007601 [Portunus trituberculatus]|uniref:Uncharacterized protein n=1 Tax=Portunus trituberculatus TaxID=210409 RepID=A0A5B7D2U3_PORTR|nr:hypothetical protein [Portunus trituberculatus]